MTPIVTNEAVAMPESPNQKLPPSDAAVTGSGHRSTERASSAEALPAADQSQPDAPSTEVFAVYGVEPEIQAYAMAKYSRSALSMKESLREISSQKAEKFL